MLDRAGNERAPNQRYECLLAFPGDPPLQILIEITEPRPKTPKTARLQNAPTVILEILDYNDKIPPSTNIGAPVIYRDSSDAK